MPTLCRGAPAPAELTDGVGFEGASAQWDISEAASAERPLPVDEGLVACAFPSSGELGEAETIESCAG